MALWQLLDSWILLLSLALGGYLYYAFNKLTYFKKINIPYVQPIPFLGNMGPVMLQQIHLSDLVQKYYNLYPDTKYIGFYDFHNPAIMIRDPEIIKNVAVKNFDNFPDHRAFVDETQDPFFGKNLFALRGAKWREMRSLLTPAFTSNKMRMMFELMNNCAADFADYIANNSADNTTDVELKEVFTRYTNDVIATSAFGISVDSMRDPNNDFYVLGKNATNFSGWTYMKSFLVRNYPRISAFFKLRILDTKITDYFQNIIKNTVETRDKQGISRPDMLQLMMEARGKTSELVDMNIQEMTAQAFVFFFGGFDSSSNLMCYAAILMAINPKIQDKLREDVDAVMKESNGKPTYEHINGMAYLEAILYETLRMYPLVPFLDRVCQEEFELPPNKPGDKPILVKPGESIWFPVHGIHYDPKYYPDPQVFDPNRFLNKKVALNMSTYLPFGIGPRACIGNRFALLESKVVLFHLISKCNINLSHKTKLPITFKKSTFSPLIEGGFWVRFEVRQLILQVSQK